MTLELTKATTTPNFISQCALNCDGPFQLMTAPPGSPISHQLRGGLKIALALSTNEKPARRLLQIPRQDLCFSRSVTTRGPQKGPAITASRPTVVTRTVVRSIKGAIAIDPARNGAPG